MADPTSSDSGIRLGRYRLVERIGSGGMAEVFRATTEGASGFTRELCIKRILPAFAGESDFVRMFVHEAQVTGRLSHANIASVFDFAEHEGAHFLVMELVDGPDLRKLLTALATQHIPMPVDVALYIVRGMLDALHYAHERTEPDGRPLDLVHRDISPHNILVSYAGEVKITDFGIAKARTLGMRTKTGQIKGKLAYMAPEQALGQSLDARTDLWAVGVVLYEMLAAERPFQASTDVELSAAIMTGRSTPLTRHRRDIPKPVEQLVAGLLTVDASRRTPSAAHAIAALSQAIRDAGIAPASSTELAALVARAVPRTRVAPSLPPARDPTELLPGAPQRSPPPPFRVAGPHDPTGTHGERVDPYEATAAGASPGVSAEPIRGSLTSIDPRPLGASPPPTASDAVATAAGRRSPSPTPGSPPAAISPQAPAAISLQAPAQIALTPPGAPAATVPAVIPPAALTPPGGPSTGPMRPTDRGGVDGLGDSKWTAGADAKSAKRRASWAAGTPTPTTPGKHGRQAATRVPFTRRPACLAIAFFGFLVLGLLGGAVAWYVVKGRRVRRAPRPAATAAWAEPEHALPRIVSSRVS